MERQPLGLSPRKFADERRFAEVCGAISRAYNQAYPIQSEWIEEYNFLAERLRGYGYKAPEKTLTSLEEDLRLLLITLDDLAKSYGHSATSYPDKSIHFLAKENAHVTIGMDLRRLLESHLIIEQPIL